MDQNGFEFKPLRANIAPTPSNNPPFSMLQRPNNSRKPFSFIQTQSRNNTENHSAPSTSQIPQISTTRRHVEPRMKQEPSEHTSLFPNARQQHTLIPQARNESKTQPPSHSHKLRAFTMMPPTYDNQSSFDTPQYSSSPKGSFNVHHDSRSYAHSNPNQSQEPLRSHSVAHSRSPSVQIDPDFDAEDADLSQLMSKRIREAKMVKSKLAEERLATAALESRLAAQTAASEASALALKSRIADLEAREAARQAKADEDLRVAKAQTEDAEEKLQDMTMRLNDVRVAARSGLEQVGNKLSIIIYSSLQVYLKDLKSEYNASQDVVRRLSEELTEIRQSSSDAARGFESSDVLSRNVETRALIDDLQSDRASAHQVIDMLRDKLHLLSAQVVEARERVAELEAIREGKIERVETKVEELVHKLVKKEEEGARGLADAAALEAQLHETGEKLREVLNTLEQRDLELGAFREQKVAWEWELKEKCAKIISLQSLSEDIVSLNERIGDLKEENISLECQLKEKCSRISALQTLETELSALKEVKTALQFKTNEDRSKIAALQISENELETRLSVVRDELETKLSAVRDEKAALECEVTECRCKIATLQDSQKATAAQLQQATDKAHQQEAQLTQLRAELADNAHRQDTQLVQLRAELKSVEDAKEQFRSSLEVSQQSATQLTQEVQALTVRGALLQEKSGEQAIRLDKLGADSSKLTNEASAREEELRQAKTKNSVLQERLDSQALTLKLAKEQSGDLQERLLISESSHIAKLESATGKLNIEIAVLREQKAGLQATLNQVTEDATTQRNGYLGAAVDYENKLNKQEETHTKLVQAEERRAMSAEREAADAKRLVDDLIQQVESARAELEDAKKKSRDAASRESLGMEGEAVVLRARLEEVEGENSRLQHRAKILNKRYKDGDLSDSEKSFVNSLMQMSQSIHEQDIVAKENELRRRENMITSLQTRIETLESTLARLLKERGKEGDPNSKSMVDLSLWMSSSPRSAQKADAQPVASSSTHIRPPSPTVFVPDTPPVKKSSKATKPAASKPAPPTVHRGHKTLSAIDHDDEPLTDSEDETPISTTLGKRSRTPTSAKTDEPSRPARRVRATTSRNTTSRKVDPESSKKLAEGVKSKQRKRR